MTTTGSPDDAALVAALNRAGLAEVDGSPLARALYSSDASLYRVPPRVVAFPRHEDEIEAALGVCREAAVPLTMRGAGTSIAGNAVGPGVVLDTSRHLGGVVGVDPEARSAVVQPGCVHATLQRAASVHGLRFGPDPSTHTRCTIGGMVGNDACGARALGWGRTAGNLLGLDVVTGSGRRLLLASPRADGEESTTRMRDRLPDGLPDAPELAALRGLVAGDLAAIRTSLGRFSRQVSGYALANLLPENGFDVVRALAGSEGTLAVVRRATVRLVPDPPHSRLVVLGFADMPSAADAAPALLPFSPTACEGLDSRLVDRLLRRGVAVPDLPRGAGWLMVEVSGDDAGEVDSRASAVVGAGAGAGALDHLAAGGAGHARALWRIREDGSGLASRTADGAPAYAGWEDSAVPVERLGGYLRDLEDLLGEHRLTGMPYGHFGEGCLHLRLDFPFQDTVPPSRRDPAQGPAAFRAFLDDAARLVARHGGSLSGEHGDGRARSALLHHQYDPHVLDLFARVKRIFDPEGVLNPGVLVDPAPVDAGLRTSAAVPVGSGTVLGHRYPDDAGDFARAVHRCTGVAKCRADLRAVNTFMCPSFLATREEKDSTRGRARVLQELTVRPEGTAPDWRDPRVHAALDLCLSCKACASDCPTGVDMAAYKAEVLDRAYAGRRRPASHYALGRLPVWADLASRWPRLANALLGSPLARPARALAGVDRRRDLPVFAPETFRRSMSARRSPGGTMRGARVAPLGRVAPHGRVALFVDTFTDHFCPSIGAPAVRVLTAAGYAVEVVREDVCCGLTWISTGQLGTARRRLAATVAALEPFARQGVRVVGLEPSCTAVLRHDVHDLLPGPAADAVSAAVRTLAEVLTATPGWTPPDVTGTTLVAQPHCHHHAVMGWDTDARLLERAGAVVTRLAGCCGLAGNWGAERGHHDVSVAIAEASLLPAIRAAGPDAVVLADGFSCRTQVAGLAGRQAVHLAELLDR